MIDRFVVSVLVVLAGCIPLANPEGAIAASGSEGLIRSEFESSRPGRGLLVKARDDVSTAEVCFDRCDYYEWDGTIHSEAAWDFILMFEYSVGFGSKANTFRAVAAKPIRSVVAKYGKYCAPLEKGDRLVCDWGMLARELSMKVGIATYDEGQRCFAWRDLASMEWPSKSTCFAITDSPWK